MSRFRLAVPTRGPGRLEASGSLTSAGAVGRRGSTPTGWEERSAFIGASNAAAAHLSGWGPPTPHSRQQTQKKAFINHQNLKNTLKTAFFPHLLPRQQFRVPKAGPGFKPAT